MDRRLDIHKSIIHVSSPFREDSRREKPEAERFLVLAVQGQLRSVFANRSRLHRNTCQMKLE